jgi:hypothetical protein
MAFISIGNSVRALINLRTKDFILHCGFSNAMGSASAFIFVIRLGLRQTPLRQDRRLIYADVLSINAASLFHPYNDLFFYHLKM